MNLIICLCTLLRVFFLLAKFLEITVNLMEFNVVIFGKKNVTSFSAFVDSSTFPTIFVFLERSRFAGKDCSKK